MDTALDTAFCADVRFDTTALTDVRSADTAAAAALMAVSAEVICAELVPTCRISLPSDSFRLGILIAVSY
jgi:hypothetical protein